MSTVFQPLSQTNSFAPLEFQKVYSMGHWLLRASPRKGPVIVNLEKHSLGNFPKCQPSKSLRSVEKKTFMLLRNSTFPNLLFFSFPSSQVTHINTLWTYSLRKTLEKYCLHPLQEFLTVLRSYKFTTIASK